MPSESWGEFIIGLLCLYAANVSFFGGCRGIIKQELHWADHSDYSTGAKGTLRGRTAVAVGFLYIFIGLMASVTAIFFLSRLEWLPLSQNLFILLTVLSVFLFGLITGVWIYRRDIEREKELKKYKDWIALSRKPTPKAKTVIKKIPEAPVVSSGILPMDVEDGVKIGYKTFFIGTILPALDYMIKEGQTFPDKAGSHEKWREILGSMEEGFKLTHRPDYRIPLSENDRNKISRAFDLFKEYFFYLKIGQFNGKLPLEWEEYAKLDYTSFFLDTIPLALDYMANEGHGTPNFGFFSFVIWEKVLMQMKEGFALARAKEWTHLSEEDKLSVAKSFDLFEKYFDDLWD